MNEAAKVLDFLKANAEAFVPETSVVDKRDYSVVSYTYEMYPEDFPSFIEEHLSNSENLELKVTTNEEMVDLRFDSANECTHICILTNEGDGLIDFLGELGFLN